MLVSVPRRADGREKRARSQCEGGSVTLRTEARAPDDRTNHSSHRTLSGRHDRVKVLLNGHSRRRAEVMIASRGCVVAAVWGVLFLWSPARAEDKQPTEPQQVVVISVTV